MAALFARAQPVCSKKMVCWSLYPCYEFLFSFPWILYTVTVYRNHPSRLQEHMFEAPTDFTVWNSVISSRILYQPVGCWSIGSWTEGATAVEQSRVLENMIIQESQCFPCWTVLNRELHKQTGILQHLQENGVPYLMRSSVIFCHRNPWLNEPS